MSQDLQDREDAALSALFGQGQTMDDLAQRFGTTREGVRQRIVHRMGKLADSSRALRSSRGADEDAIGDLAESVIIGDDDCFFWTLEEKNSGNVRWCNPSASDGAKQLATLQQELLARATNAESPRLGGNRVLLVLTDALTMNREVLHAMIVGADEAVIVASRTNLRAIIRRSKNGASLES